jgi:beta-galactosidase
MSCAVVGVDGLDGRYTGTVGVDWITPTTARPLAGYEDRHLRRFAAATVNEFGKGAGYYVGTVVKEDAFYDALIAAALKRGRVAAVVKPPPGVEASIRQGKGRKLLFLVNHTEEPQTVHVPAGKKELLSETTTAESLTLGIFGVAVIKLS